MQGGITKVLAGVALAVGGGVAGATLVADTPQQAPPAQIGSLAAETTAAQAEKAQRASARHALRTAQRARRIARRARSKADESLSTAVSLLDNVDKALADSANALTAAQQAESDAAAALQTANTANSRLNSTEMVSNTVAGTATAPADGDYHAADGPSVTVTVPSSGKIEVWSTVTVESTEGAAGLFRDGQQVPIPGQDGICGPDDALLSSNIGSPVTISTPPSSGSFGVVCGTIGDAPSAVLFNEPPGQHTYELRYADCGCDADEAEFSNRTLRVAPRL